MIRWFVLLLVAVVAHAATVESKLDSYRIELDAFRAEYGGARELPDAPFFLAPVLAPLFAPSRYRRRAEQRT